MSMDGMKMAARENRRYCPHCLSPVARTLRDYTTFVERGYCANGHQFIMRDALTPQEWGVRREKEMNKQHNAAAGGLGQGVYILKPTEHLAWVVRVSPEGPPGWVREAISAGAVMVRETGIDVWTPAGKVAIPVGAWLVRTPDGLLIGMHDEEFQATFNFLRPLVETQGRLG